MISSILKHPSDTVVVTGGETIDVGYDIFNGSLKNKGLKTHLETSETNEASGVWDWICLSQKISQP